MERIPRSQTCMINLVQIKTIIMQQPPSIERTFFNKQQIANIYKKNARDSSLVRKKDRIVKAWKLHHQQQRNLPRKIGHHSNLQRMEIRTRNFLIHREDQRITRETSCKVEVRNLWMESINRHHRISFQ